MALAVVAHGATLHFCANAMRLAVAIANANVSLSIVSGTVDAMVELLRTRENWMSHRAIEARLIASCASVIVVRLALKLAWEQGVLTYRNDTSGWNRENRKFGLTVKLYPGLDMSMESSKAAGELIREYFDRYGPASLRDAMWWSGLPRSAITTAMNESPRRFVSVRASWCQSPLYMYDDRYDEFQNEGPQLQAPTLTLNFLAHEDVALKAYFESRVRYLGQLPPRCALNQIGEVLPTIMHCGQVVGTWAWDVRKMTVTHSLIRGYGSPELNKDVRRQAKILSKTLRLRWVSITKCETDLAVCGHWWGHRLLFPCSSLIEFLLLSQCLVNVNFQSICDRAEINEYIRPASSSTVPVTEVVPTRIFLCLRTALNNSPTSSPSRRHCCTTSRWLKPRSSSISAT